MKQLPEGVKRVVLDSNPILRQVSAPVTEFDLDLKQLAVDMIETMVNYQGVGLSAIQIGVPKRIIIAVENDNLQLLVNPVITRKLQRETETWEGCLSIPGRQVRVSRPAKCDVDYQDLDGNHHSACFSGLMARIVQHEMDHLDGILITDKAQ
jgi:peptide deformylase